jgi:hypothetical protein
MCPKVKVEEGGGGQGEMVGGQTARESERRQLFKTRHPPIKMLYILVKMGYLIMTLLMHIHLSLLVIGLNTYIFPPLCKVNLVSGK